MSGRLRHVAINAVDVERSRRFYADVMGWTAAPHGAPDFLRLADAGGGASGALVVLQRRRELLPGARTNGLECTFAVDDLAAVAAAVQAGGGRILMEPTAIPGVGDLLFFADPDDNVVGAMQFAPGAEPAPPGP